jgi:transposase-like protein
MKTKKYCPYCGSFDITRVHRGFFKKIILRKPPMYKCHTCKQSFAEKQMENNVSVDDPFTQNG